jgi:HSP20 family protein
MMELMPWRPFGEIRRLRRDIDDLWRRFFGETALDPTVSEWMPSVDVSETDEHFLVKAELPGLEAKDVDIDVSGDLLTIKGEKKTEEERKEESFYSRERFFGAFQRAIRLPAGVNTDKVDATFKNGVLSITLPKTEESKRKKIEVKTQ